MSQSTNSPRPKSGLLQRAADIHSHETRAVLLAMLYFFLLFGSYSVVKPVRDAMVLRPSLSKT